MNEKIYDVLKWISLVFMPALTTFYGVIGATCHIPYTQETLTIMAGFTTFLGTILGVSNLAYKKENPVEHAIMVKASETDDNGLVG